MESFHQLILWGESQTSNGTVRVVERPDGESRFAVAYGSVPDDDLRVLLVCPLLYQTLFEASKLILAPDRHLHQVW